MLKHNHLNSWILLQLLGAHRAVRLLFLEVNKWKTSSVKSLLISSVSTFSIYYLALFLNSVVRSAGAFSFSSLKAKAHTIPFSHTLINLNMHVFGLLQDTVLPRVEPWTISLWDNDDNAHLSHLALSCELIQIKSFKLYITLHYNKVSRSA